MNVMDLRVSCGCYDLPGYELRCLGCGTDYGEHENEMLAVSNDQLPMMCTHGENADQLPEAAGSLLPFATIANSNS